MTPARGRLFVRPIETAETLPGGRIVLTETMRHALTAQQAEVVAIGAPSYCDDEGCERPHDVERCHVAKIPPQSWIVTAPRSLSETDTDGLYVVHQDDVLAVLQP